METQRPGPSGILALQNSEDSRCGLYCVSCMPNPFEAGWALLTEHGSNLLLDRNTSVMNVKGKTREHLRHDLDQDWVLIGTQWLLTAGREMEDAIQPTKLLIYEEFLNMQT